MMLAFGQTIAGIALLGIIMAVFIVIGRYLYLRARSKQRTVFLRIATGIASLILVTMISSAVREGAIDLNPMIRSSGELVGEYAGGGYSLKFRADGTFDASGFNGATTGSWSHDDWNLTLSGLGLSMPRVITRNGRLCIAPFYAGVDSHHGVLLKKQ